MRFRPWTIGLFIVLGLGFSTAILFLIGNRHQAFTRHIELYTNFSNLDGLASGAKVRVSGLDAGELKKIEIPNSPSGNFRLQLQVEEKAKDMIRKDSVVSIETEGVVGDKFLSIKKGTPQAEEAASGSTLPSKEPIDLGDLLDKGSGLLTDVHGTVTDLRSRLNVTLESINRTVNHGDDLITGLKPEITKIARTSNQITSKIDGLMTDINAGKGPAGLILKDEATAQQLRTTLSNAQEISANLNQTSIRANQVITDFQSRNLIANAQVTLDNLQALSLQLNATLKDALAEDNLGVDTSQNLRETLSNLNLTTTNLAEDTEALKHNFFFRGFFKKRGFYNLDQLTPETYLAACEHNNCAASRTWIPAADMFVQDESGTVQLSASGRSQIDTRIAPQVNQLPGHIVVVEGYSETGSPDRQYVLSRRRADLVRRYLEKQYHLKHGDVGIVALQSKPPEDAGRDHWDGAAIIVVNQKGKK